MRALFCLVTYCQLTSSSIKRSTHSSAHFFKHCGSAPIDEKERGTCLLQTSRLSSRWLIFLLITLCVFEFMEAPFRSGRPLSLHVDLALSRQVPLDAPFQWRLYSLRQSFCSGACPTRSQRVLVLAAAVVRQSSLKRRVYTSHRCAGYEVQSFLWVLPSN